VSLIDGLSAEAVRTSVDKMRDAVRRLAEEHHDVWVGPFTEMAHALTEVARVDLCLARLVEGHVDALRILDQAGVSPRPGVYGVWASRSAGTGVAATPEGDGWRLTGESRFSSGIDVIDRALVPGWIDDDKHLLFDVDATAVDADRDSWHTSAMDASRSFAVRVDLPAGQDVVIGPPGFYLDRRGFPIGGLEVAAVWLGGAQSVLEQVVDGLRRFRPTAHQTRRVGVMEQAVRQARLVVDATAQRLPSLEGEALVREAAVARTTVAWACNQVLDEAGRVVGPAGLSGTARLARTVADLAIYVRQHHLDLTLESLGRDALRDRETAG
jgi:hypothetical protein